MKIKKLKRISSFLLIMIITSLTTGVFNVSAGADFSDRSSFVKEASEKRAICLHAPEDNSDYWVNYVCKNCGSNKEFDSIASATADPITISRKQAEVETGKSFQLCVDDVFNRVTWSSADNSIATVDEKGYVTAVAEGVTQIKATDPGDNVAVCEVTVAALGSTGRPVIYTQAALWAEEKGVVQNAVSAPEDTISREDLKNALRISGAGDENSIVNAADEAAGASLNAAKVINKSVQTQNDYEVDILEVIEAIYLSVNAETQSMSLSLPELGKILKERGVDAYKAIQWAVEKGILIPAEDRGMRLFDYCTKEQLSVMIFRLSANVLGQDMGDFKTASALSGKDAIEVSDTGISHDWEEVVVEQVFIDEAELAASLRGLDEIIDIPEGMGTYYSVTCYGVPGWKLSGVEWRAIARPSGQALVHDEWIEKGAVYTNGIATLDGRYMIATTTFFGQVGDFITFQCANGYELKCIIADSKGNGDGTGSIWGHDEGKNVVEFEVDPDYYFAYGAPGSDKWFPEIKGGVVKAIRQ